MNDVAYTRYEQETSIVWDEDEKIARIYTASTVTMRKLDKLAATCPETYRCVWEQNDGLAQKYEVDKRYIRFGKPASEARKEAARRNAEKMLEGRKEVKL